MGEPMEPYTTEQRRMESWDLAHNAPGESIAVPYYQCRSCAYGTLDAEYIAAHVTGHPPIEAAPVAAPKRKE
jgi:hypothetical protein